MNVIKVNFDNIYVKKPKKLYPNIVAYKYNIVVDGSVRKILRLAILPRLDEEPLYTNFYFDIYINGTLVSRVTNNSYQENGNYIIEFSDRSFFVAEYLTIKIDGEYYNNTGNVQSVDGWTKKIYTTPICSDDLLCSEHTYVSDYINGTYIYGFYNSEDGRFYYDREVSVDNFGAVSYKFSDEFNTSVLADVIVNKIFVDVPTSNQYKWNSVNDTFVLQ